MRRRRSFRGRRFGGRPFVREAYAWDTVSFNESALSVAGGDANLLELVVHDPAGVVPSGLLEGTQTRAKRIIMKGGVGFTMSSTALAQDIADLTMALYIIDQDDTDNLVTVTTANSVWYQQRVLWFDRFTAGLVEAAGTAFPQTFNWRIDADVKLNMVLRPDQLVILGMTFTSAVSSVVAAAAVSMTARTLMVKNR